MSISQDTIGAVQDRVHIEEVLADFLTLKQKGQKLWALCPFHSERSASFSVSPDRKRYKCFGCGAQGDTVSFLMAHQGMSFTEAIQYLAQRYGITIVWNKHVDKAQQHEQEALYILLAFAQEHYRDNLAKHAQGQKLIYPYLGERGLQPGVVEHFGLGYSLDTPRGFYEVAVDKGYDAKLLEQAGLITVRSGKVWDRFRDRLMFPLHNVAGKIIGFGARSLHAQPKYINSPETLVYTKGHNLYGLYQARVSINQLDNCFLVEGYIDALALHQAGVKNTVATAGTALTDTQIQLIKRFTHKVTLVFDGDLAGVQASLKSIDRLLAHGFDVRIVPLLGSEDPASYALKVGVKAIKDYLTTQAQDFITFKAHKLLQQAEQGPEGRTKVIQELVQSLAVIPEGVKRAVYTQACGKLLEIDEKVLWEAQAQYLPQSLSPDRPNKYQSSYSRVQKIVSSPQMMLDNNGLALCEKNILRVLIQYGNEKITSQKTFAAYLFDELKDVSFSTPVYKDIFDKLKEQAVRDGSIDHTTIQDQPEQVKKLFLDLVNKSCTISQHWANRYGIYVNKEEDNLEETAFKLILRLKLRLLQQLIAKNQAELEQASSDEEATQLLHVRATLKKSEREVGKQLSMVIHN